MLRLEKLEMTGFKSFFSRTEFHFDREITAVVGPNGCGKSNIGDALNWVIGEQSVKSLRGDRMEDVIFNGSEGRRPLGMAEVSLHLKNGAEGEADESIVITRRLFRSGESEYLINGQRARLRDLQETLSRINVGSGVYSIIEQGKVDAALSSRPRERRVLIEEAAGIALYKTRKRQAEAKLEATEANLLRVHDIVLEIERQIGSLKRQAARARRYSRTVEEIAHHERIVLYHDHARLRLELDAAFARENDARATEIERAGDLARLEAQFEEGRRLLDEQDQLWRSQREELHALEREMDHQERELTLSRALATQCVEGREASLKEATALAGRLQEVSRQVEARRAEREELDRRMEGETFEKERLETSRRSIEQRIAALEADLAGRRSAFLQAVDALSESRNRHRHIEDSLESLRRRSGALDREADGARAELAARQRQRAEAQVALESAGSGAAQITSALEARRAEASRLSAAVAREHARREEARHRLHGHQERLRTLEEMEAACLGARELLEGIAKHDGVLADGLKVPAHLEAAAEIYLERYLDAAVVDGVDTAVRAVASLKRAQRGRAGFLPVPVAAEPAPIIGLPDEARTDPGFVGRLGELVEIDAARRGAMNAALARVLVAADLDAALRLRRLAPFFDYVTLEGDILHTSGLIEGGSPRPEAAGLLSRRRLKADLLTAIETGRAHLDGLDALVAGLENDRVAADASCADLGGRLAAAEKDLVALQHRLAAAAEEESRAGSKLKTIGQEVSMAREEAAALTLELERQTGTMRDLESARGVRESEITAAQEEVGALRSAAAETAEAAAMTRSSLSAATERLEALDMDLARMLEVDQDLRDRIEREAARQSDLSRRAEEAARAQAAAIASLGDLGARRTGIETLVRDGEVLLDERRRDLEGLAHQVRAARASLDSARGAREALTLQKERVSADLRHLIEAAIPAAPEGRVDPVCSDALAALFGALTDEDRTRDLESVKTALADLRDRRDRLGPVNMLALDEFRQLEERYGFLTAQRNDLTEAVASLKETIARINRTSRERFLDAFEKIRAGFSETFKVLFGGGRADLRLMTDEGEDDILECGLEIIAQPPGKRLQSVTLLSGGEKALTAIGLLFAIFRFRPSPFCLLDEVDAPLDEANVIRFNEMLKSMASGTQFVMITHNRRSMEAADLLYGITMEEPGVSRTMSVVLGGGIDRAQAVRSLPAILTARHRGTVRPPRAGLDASAGNGGSLPASRHSEASAGKLPA